MSTKQKNDKITPETSSQVDAMVSPLICWKCKEPLDEIGGDYKYETFKYKAMDGTIKTNYCCLVCQIEMSG